MQKLMGLVRRCVDDYGMIRPGDKIAVGVSGGKDSLALAVCMRDLSRYGRVPFKVSFLAMDPGYTPENRKRMIENAEKLGKRLRKTTDMGEFRQITKALIETMRK